MSKVHQENYPHLNRIGIHRVIGQTHAATSAQAAAASASASLLWVATFMGQLGDLFIQLSAAVASGESMTYALLKNGSSVMVGGTPLTVNSTNGAAKAQIKMLDNITEAGKSFVPGDVYAITRVYTAGGGPTPMAHNSVVLEPSLGSSYIA
jgi:hypothetical protein